MGDWTNGWALVVLDGRPTFLLNCASTPYRVEAPEPLTAGRHAVAFRFRRQGRAGTGVLFVDDVEVVETELPQGLGAAGMQIGGGGLRLGHDAGFPGQRRLPPAFRLDGHAAPGLLRCRSAHPA